uniref:Rab effector MyRIP/Melanophilin domain-containing protein n=1 Tax=Catagonus wagneri TaxID=51154 RepID=A0A8C3YR01_9CETA
FFSVFLVIKTGQVTPRVFGRGDGREGELDGRPLDMTGSLGPNRQVRTAASGKQPSCNEKTKRLLRVHSLDLEVDSDDSAPSCGHAPSLSSVPAATASRQTLTGEPCAEGTSSHEPDARASGCRPQPEEQTGSLPPAGPDALAKLCLPGEFCSVALGVTATPGSVRSEQLRQQYLADVDTSDEEVIGAQRVSSHRSRQRGLPSSESQCPAGAEPTDADVQEAALKRKLEELTRRVSDHGASSTEEEEGRDEGAALDGSTSIRGLPRPAVCPAAGPAPRWEKGPRGPQDPAQPKRSPDEELSELEDRVATTASEVRQTESEVSDIESRIAALRAAGLAVKPSGKARGKSNLPVFLPRLAGKHGQTPKDPSAHPSDEVKVCVPPSELQRRKRVKDWPGSFRSSAYRGSLTQRNPNGRKANTSHSFAVSL